MKNKILKNSLLVLILVLVFGACSKDDLCPETQLTTPKLIILFKNINNPLENKEISGLSILTLGDSIPVSITSNDSIAIPLRTSLDATSFLFTKDSSDENLKNTDTLLFNYQRENVYINRACSFRTIFTNVSGHLGAEQDSTKWIQDLLFTNPTNTTIENENQAHITILH